MGNKNGKFKGKGHTLGTGSSNSGGAAAKRAAEAASRRMGGKRTKTGANKSQLPHQFDAKPSGKSVSSSGKLAGGTYTVEFKDAILGLGLADGQKGVQVDKFVNANGRKSPAEKCGQIGLGDLVVRVGTQDTRAMGREEVHIILQTAPRPVNVTFTRALTTSNARDAMLRAAEQRANKYKSDRTVKKKYSSLPESTATSAGHASTAPSEEFNPYKPVFSSGSQARAALSE